MEPWRFPPPSMFGSPSPAFIRYSPRPLLPMYSRANPRLLPPNFFHHPPPWTRPPPPAPEDASSIVARWEAEVSPSVTERRKALEAKKRITVIEFKKKLKRWKELLDASGTLDSQEELDCLQRECTDPEILEFIKRKIARGRRRRQNHNTLPIVLPTPVSETLSHIAPADVPPSSSQTVDKSLTPPGKTVEDDTIPRQKYLDELKKASAYCQSRLGLLKKLKILREARVNQFRNQVPL
uniref:Protein FYV10 n=1 Tax=Mesocestoides corti TaxID=53468 RepID=A0A5K3EI05_MESCO